MKAIDASWTADELADLPIGTRDPARYDAPRATGPTAPPREMTALETERYIARFRDDVTTERARLALTDPVGEAEAVVLLDGVHARQTLLRPAEAPARRPVAPWHPLDRRPDAREFLARVGADPNRGRGVVRCPAHEDRSPSLSWRLADDGRALVHCFAGCSFADILAAVA